MERDTGTGVSDAHHHT